MSSEEIRALRQKMGLSMEQFAHELGTTTSTVFRWEKGERKPGRMAQKLLMLLKDRLSETSSAKKSRK